ncbi:MAG: flagellar hook assembly protein FlgD [Armatimonadetes bacterium]|nr:flagellar hook assembly protein FlgD [Armatimonadota bacterium]
MASISSVTNYDPSLGRTGGTAKKDLDSDTFLQLLVAQLRYQDPMSGMDQQAFMQQLSTMSSMQQQQSINANLSDMVKQNQVTQATGMIGRTVKGTVDDKEIEGKVTAVTISSDKVMLKVGTDSVPYSSVYEVT